MSQFCLDLNLKSLLIICIYLKYIQLLYLKQTVGINLPDKFRAYLHLLQPLGQFMYQFSSDQSLSDVRLFATPWTAAHQANLSITNSQSLFKLMSIELVMPSNHLILCYPLLLPSIFPSIRVSSSESVLHITWPKYWSITSVSVLPMNIHGLFPLELTGLISLQSKGLSRIFSNTTIQKHQFFGAQLSLWSISHLHA